MVRQGAPVVEKKSLIAMMRESASLSARLMCCQASAGLTVRASDIDARWPNWGLKQTDDSLKAWRYHHQELRQRLNALPGISLLREDNPPPMLVLSVDRAISNVLLESDSPTLGFRGVLVQPKVDKMTGLRRCLSTSLEPGSAQLSRSP